MSTTLGQIIAGNNMKFKKKMFRNIEENGNKYSYKYSNN